MEGCFACADAKGPTRIVHVYAPSIQLRGILVVDNVARDPSVHRSVGRLRMAEDVRLAGCFRLARDGLGRSVLCGGADQRPGESMPP